MASLNSPQSAVLVGRWSSAEMEPLRRLAAKLLADWPVREFRHLPGLLDAVQAEGLFPELVIVCQQHREEFSPAGVHQALEQLPLARWVCVSGTWCASEGRHGSRWPLAVRVPLQSAERRLRQEMAVIRGELPAITFTASREEVFEFDVRPDFPALTAKTTSAGSVLVVSPDRAFRAWVEDLARAAGYRPLDRTAAEPPALLIVDVDPDSEITRSILQSRQRRFPEAQVIALGGLPCVDQIEHFTAQGVAAVLSKGTPTATLLETLQRLAAGFSP